MSIVKRIREVTRDLHASVENTEVSRSIMLKDVSKQQYADFLHATLIMHDDVEKIIHPAMQQVIASAKIKSKVASLIKDLNALNAVKPSVDVKYIDGNYNPGFNFNLGMLYVIEGSSLGGRIIHSHLNAVLGPDIPSDFLNIYGNELGQQWKSFLQFLEEYHQGKSEQESHEIIDGAVYGFKRAEFVFSLK